MDSRVFILRYPSDTTPRHKFFLRSPATGIAINSSHFLQGDITLMSITVPRRVLSTKRSPSLAADEQPCLPPLSTIRYPLALQRRLLVISLFLYAAKSCAILPIYE